MSRRLAPAIIVFLLALVAIVPSALSLPQHLDEGHYAYISAYYGGKISRLDLAPVGGANEFLDPGWDPVTFWSLTQPMGPRYIYAAVLGVTGAPTPATPWVIDDPLPRDPTVPIADYTRTVMRSCAVLLAAIGLALLAHRLRWPAAVAIGVFLLIPHVRDDLARAWAEGPLLFSFGLAAAAWGTRWFAPACGLAVLCKLTALPLWLLAFHHGFGGSRYRHIAGIVVPWLVWTALMPPAWFLGGPTYLGVMLRMRWAEYGIQRTVADPEIWGSLFGHYFPTRYLWPVELAVLLMAAWVVSRYWQRRHAVQPAV